MNAYKHRATTTAEPRAIRRGKKPNFFNVIHATAYFSHSFMRSLFAPKFTDLRQYAFSSFFPATSICAWAQRGSHPVNNAHVWSGNQTSISIVLDSNTVEPHPSANQPDNVSMATKIGWTVLIIATLYVCYFSHLGAIGFVGPDEPRYAWIARAMVETGDWVTPRLYGKPWFEKPVLYYWGAAASFKLFGVSEAAARLPSAISALLATLALAWLALRLYGAETARWLLLLLPTTVGMIGFSHAAATDMPFSAMLTIAMVCAAVALRLVPAAPHSNSSIVVAGLATPPAATPQSLPFAPPAAATAPSPPPAPPPSTTPSFSGPLWPALILFGFFLGLAVLAKGPAAIILSGGAVFFWAIFTKRWRDAFRLFHPAAIAAFCATALPWYILCARRNPDFFRIFILEHNFKRYLTPEFLHIQPFWYYGPIILIAIFPWTLSILPAFSEAVGSFRERHWQDSSSLFLVFWALFPLAFFSFSQSKLPGYILPSLPPLAALATRSVVAGFQRSSAVVRWVAILTAMLVMVPAGVLWYLAAISPTAFGSPHVSKQWLWSPLSWPSLCALVGLFALFLALWNRLQAAFVIVIIIQLFALTALYHSFVATRGEDLSIRGSVQAAKNYWPDFAPDQTSMFNLRRGDQYSLNFYVHHEVPPWSPDKRRPSWVFGARRLWGGDWTEGMDCVIATKLDTISQPVVCRDTGAN
jgi:4-amino-4-deoxy-L-arabinose transferase-like glycosyltransferase